MRQWAVGGRHQVSPDCRPPSNENPTSITPSAPLLLALFIASASARATLGKVGVSSGAGFFNSLGDVADAKVGLDKILELSLVDKVVKDLGLDQRKSD